MELQRSVRQLLVEVEEIREECDLINKSLFNSFNVSSLRNSWVKSGPDEYFQISPKTLEITAFTAEVIDKQILSGSMRDEIKLFLSEGIFHELTISKS